MMTTLNNRVSALFADPLQAVLNDVAPWNAIAHSAGKLAPLSIWEDDEAIYVETDLPGVSTDDLQLDIEKSCLTIKGTRKAPERPARYDERCFGGFERKIQLEDWIEPESIEANFSDGVLQVRLAKKPVAKRQAIPINRPSSNAVRLESESN